MERKKEIANRVIEWLSIGKASPYECRLSFTNRCNLACLPCVSRGRPSYESHKELSKDEYLRIVKEAAKLGAQRFDICGGGEPFCRPDAIVVMEEIKKLGLEGTVSTNGTVLTEDVIRRLVNSEWDEIRFSINGPDAETDDRLRGLNGAFNLSTKTIKKLVSLKKESNKDKPDIIITPIITSMTHNKISEFVELSNALGVGSLILQPFMAEILPDLSKVDDKERQTISDSLKLSEGKVKEFQTDLKEAKKLADIYGINNNFESVTEKSIELDTAELIRLDSKEQKNEILSIPCYQPWWVLDITVDGGVGPCPRSDTRENVKGKKLNELWYGAFFNSVRKMLANGKIPEMCKSCCVISTFDNQRIRETISNTLFKSDQECHSV